MDENIELLGDVLGLDLEVEAEEKDVGPFRADILCKNTADDSWVLVENQLERTDHSHLGQLLTYAAGLEVVTIVWVAASFTEEHRAALDWLNSVTDESFAFFGLEIELWAIGDSPAAPKFNVVSKPNDWTKQVARGKHAVVSELTPTKSLQVEYWSAFRDYLKQAGSRLKATKPLPQHWMNIALGRSGANLTAIASTWNNDSGTWGGEVRTEVYLGPTMRMHFGVLEAQRGKLETAVGEPLIWDNAESKKSARIYLRKSADIEDRDDWPQQHEWLREHLEKLHAVFSPIVRGF